MNIVIISDTHRRGYRIKKVLEMHPHADLVVFLGDGADEALPYLKAASIPYVAVAGNCDFYSDLPEEVILTLEGYRILLTHGHIGRVKEGPTHLASYAYLKGCDIVLFGHTHERCELYISEPHGPLYLFNPGSLGEPRCGNPSFGHLNLSKQGVLFSHGELPPEY